MFHPPEGEIRSFPWNLSLLHPCVAFDAEYHTAVLQVAMNAEV